MEICEDCEYTWHIQTHNKPLFSPPNAFLVPVVKSSIFPENQGIEAVFKWQLICNNCYLALYLISAPVGLIKVIYNAVINENNFIGNQFNFDNNGENTGSCIYSHEIIEHSKVKTTNTFAQNCSSGLFGATRSFEIPATQHITYIKINIMAVRKKFFSNPNTEIVQYLHVCSSTQLLSSLVTNPKFFDLKIQVDSKIINAHKAILAAVSPIFHEELNNNQECILINNCEYDDVAKMIDFIYKGHVEISDYNTSVNLLKLSDMYEIQNLKQLCNEYIYSSINIDNVLKVLLLADVYKDENLKQYAVNYLLNNPKAFSSSNFKKLQKERPDLLLELLPKMAESILSLQKS